MRPNTLSLWCEAVSSLNTMLISSTYLCPVRGLASLEPPEPVRLGRAAKVAKGLGIERLTVPILEEALVGSGRASVRYLDGLIQALDRVDEAGMPVWLIAPAHKVLDLNWAAPYLVKANRDPKADPVFVDGRVRNLRAFDWWKDPSVLQKRIRAFHGLVDAVSGHPALTGWRILDRSLEWSRPDIEQADLMLKAFLAEIRERDESGTIFLGLGWPELLDPEMAQVLARQVDGVSISGGERKPPGITTRADLAGELGLASYLGTMARWLLDRPTEIEIGWGMLDNASDTEETIEGFKRLAGHGVAGANWISLIDPEPPLHTQPPWVLRSGLERIGLLDRGLEPKEQVGTWLKGFRFSDKKTGEYNFIDISEEEYLDDPHTHLPRLWQHFQEQG
jgi:hypothetical protein